MRVAASLAAMVMGVAACAVRPDPPPATVVCDATARRWAPDPRGTTRDIRVWIDASAQTLDGWQPYGWRRLRFAMNEWNSIQLPIRFVEAPSLREADVIVDVIAQIPGQDAGDRDQAGITTVTHQSGTIIKAFVFVATSAPFQVRYTLDDQLANLIHELGHAIGLPHTPASGALMSARRGDSQLTAIDIALARNHYAGCASPSRPPSNR